MAASYVAENQYLHARNLLNELIPELRRLKHSLLLGNALELMGQMELKEGRFTQSREMLLAAKEILKGTSPRYQIYVEKWLTILSLFEIKLQKKNLEANDRVKIKNIKDEAWLAKDWETVRDCELYEAILFDDTEMLQKVFFGTPYPSFLKRVRRLKQDFKQEPQWVLKFGAKDPSLVLDLNHQKAPPLAWKLFSILLTDFYRPLPLGELYQFLYPGEYFNPYSSEQKISFLVQELRKCFHNENIPIEIVVQNREYRLKFVGELALQLSPKNNHKSELPKSLPKSLIEIEKNLVGRAFTSSEVSKLLSLSQRQARRILAEAIKNKTVKKDSKNPKLMWIKKAS